MVFANTEDKILSNSLINRQYTDPVGSKGWIISADLTPDENRCEVAVRFEDSYCLLETRFSAQKWFDMTKEPKVRKIVNHKRGQHVIQ